jgi:autotransporter translocation and assembly factor TamB
MKSISRLILASSVALVALWAADATGKWTAEMQGRNGNTMTVNMNLKADGAKLTGTVSGRNGDTEISDGKIDGDNVSFTVIREFNGNQIKQNYKGKLDGDAIHFTLTMEGGMGNGQPRTFDAHRATT